MPRWIVLLSTCMRFTMPIYYVKLFLDLLRSPSQSINTVRMLVRSEVLVYVPHFKPSGRQQRPRPHRHNNSRRICKSYRLDEIRTQAQSRNRVNVVRCFISHLILYPPILPKVLTHQI
jgi:hypothetical protein